MTAPNQTAATPATPLLDAMIDDMLHGDGIPRCAEWDRLQSFAATMERDRAALVAALRGLHKWCDANINGCPAEYGKCMAAADEALARLGAE